METRRVSEEKRDCARLLADALGTNKSQPLDEVARVAYLKETRRASEEKCDCARLLADASGTNKSQPLDESRRTSTRVPIERR